MRWTDEHRIETPEQVDVDLELAGLGSRLVAQLVDWLLKGAATLVVGVIGLVLAVFAARVNMTEAFAFTVGVILVTVIFVLWWVYDIGFEIAWNGQTPGKRFAGIRVLRDGGAGLDPRAALIRGFLKVVDGLPAFNGLGAAFVAFTGKRQRIGDLAAGTIVVRERATRAPLDLAAMVRDLAGDEHKFAASELARCTPTDRHVLRSFFVRYRQLDAGPRDALAVKLAEQLLARTGYRPPYPVETGVPSTVFLAALFGELEAHAGRRY